MSVMMDATSVHPSNLQRADPREREGERGREGGRESKSQREGGWVEGGWNVEARRDIAVCAALALWTRLGGVAVIWQ